MNVIGGTTDVTTYFVMRLAATGVGATGLTIANMDLQYVRTGEAPSAKVDAVALAATNTAHTDNRGIEIDATDQPGLYRIDWPDEAFVAGVRQVILTVLCATCFTEHMAVDIDTPVNVAKVAGTAQTANDIGADVDAILVDTGTTLDTALAVVDGNVDSILVDTAEIGAAGAGLTAVPYNAAWDAEIQSECTDALNAYDPPTKAELDSGLAGLNDITVAEIIAGVADGSYDLQEMLRLITAACVGKSSGGGTNTLVFRDTADSKDRVTATVDADGNRSAMTLDAS